MGEMMMTTTMMMNGRRRRRRRSSSLLCSDPKRLFSSSLLVLPLWLLLLLLQQLPILVEGNRETSRDLRIINEAGFKVDIYWINRWKDDELVLNSEEGIFHGAETKINSFVGHEFEVHEVPYSKTGVCRGVDNECRRGYFQVTPNYDQVISFRDALNEIEHSDSKTTARDQAAEVLSDCKRQTSVMTTENEDDDDDDDPTKTMERLLRCIETSVNASMAAKWAEADFQHNLRVRMGSQLTHYACDDPLMNQTEPIENATWKYENTAKKRVRIMFDRPSVKIHYVEDFMSDRECGTVRAASAFDLRRVDGDGGLHASIGGVNIPWKDGGGTVYWLADKIYRYANDHISGFDLMEPELLSQSEPIHSLQYAVGDRYDNHCDGDRCGDGDGHGDDGRVGQRGQDRRRIATFLGYCNVPDVGGAVHFSNAGIHLYPKRHSAIFVYYVDPVKELLDTTGFAKYAECTPMMTEEGGGGGGEEEGMTTNNNKMVVMHHIKY